MNSFTSILFVFLFLFKGMVPNMSLECELQKIPNLLGHYQEHKSCNGNSFVRFMADHYLDFEGNEDKSGQSESEHENLPFHGSHKCCHPPAFYASEQNFDLIISDFPVENNVGYYLSSFTSDYLDSFFQPPKA